MVMVEVFKTNVIETKHARMLKEILKLEYNYEATFDLEDCDRILRIKHSDTIQSGNIIKLMKNYGFKAEILPENYPLPIIQSILNASLCQ